MWHHIEYLDQLIRSATPAAYWAPLPPKQDPVDAFEQSLRLQESDWGDD